MTHGNPPTRNRKRTYQLMDNDSALRDAYRVHLAKLDPFWPLGGTAEVDTVKA